MGGFNCSATRGGHRGEGITCNNCFSGVMPADTKCPKRGANEDFKQRTLERALHEAKLKGAVGFKVVEAGGSLISRFQRLELVDESDHTIPSRILPNFLDWYDMRHITYGLSKCGLKQVL